MVSVVSTFIRGSKIWYFIVLWIKYYLTGVILHLVCKARCLMKNSRKECKNSKKWTKFKFWGLNYKQFIGETGDKMKIKNDKGNWIQLKDRWTILQEKGTEMKQI